MLSVKTKNYIHLHLLVIIAGFTAIIGELITLEAVPLVWYRMIIAALLMIIYIKLKKFSLKVPLKVVIQFSIAGVIIALHWITFFAAIKVSNISITLAMFSTGAFFASLIEPLFFKRKIIGYEIFFGLIVFIGVGLITQTEFKYLMGIVLGISSALFSTLFAVLNGRFVKIYKPSIISFYEFIFGVVFISIFLALSGDGFSLGYFRLSSSDWIYLFILASICTAYAFIGSVQVMKYLTPYSVVLTYNLEPIYGIILAVLIFGEKEKMSPQFYMGAAIIFITVVINGILKNKKTT